MARDVSSWLPNLLGPLNLFLDGVPYLGPRRSNVNLIGMLLSDDPANDATNLIAESSLGLPSQTPDDAQATADVQGAAGFLDSTASNLPSVIDSNGRLRRLAYNLYFNITDPQFGAKVDGITDDTIAFTAALAAAAAVGGTLQLAWGNMVIAYAGQISVPTNVRILGQHAQTTGGGYESGIGSIITFTGAGGGLLWPDGTFECELEHVLLSTGATAGPAIQIASGVGVGNFHFNHFSIDHGNPNVEAFVAGASTDGCGLEDSTFEHFDIQLPAAATKPAIALYGKDGGLNTCRLQGQIHGPGIGVGLSPTAEFMRIANVDGSLTSNMAIEHIILEQPVAGGIYLYSVAESVLQDIIAVDVTSAQMTAPLFQFKKWTSGTPLACGALTLIGVNAPGIGSSSTFATLLTDGLSDYGTTCIGCHLPYVDNGVGSAAAGQTIITIGCDIGGWNGKNRPTGFTSGAVLATAHFGPSDTITVHNGLNSNVPNPNVAVPGYLKTTGSLSGAYSIDGLAISYGTGQVVRLRNTSAVFPLTIVDASESVSSSGNQIKTLRGTNIVVAPGGMVTLLCDAEDGVLYVESVNPDGYFYPSEIPGAVAIFDARYSANTTGTGIASWSSVVGTIKATQSTGSDQPTLNAGDSAYNGDYTLSGNGSQWLQAILGSAQLQPITLVIVGNITSATGSAQAFLDDNSGSTRFLLQATATTGLLAAYAGTLLQSTAVVTSPSVMALTASGASSSLYWNQSQVAAASGALGSSGITYLDIFGISGSDLLTGKIAFVGLWNRVLGNDELAKLFEYLAARYGIDAS